MSRFTNKLKTSSRLLHSKNYIRVYSAKHYFKVKNIIIIIIYLFIYLTLAEAKIFRIKNVYIAVAIPLNDKDGMIIKINEKKITKKNKIQWLEKLIKYSSCYSKSQS